MSNPSTYSLTIKTSNSHVPSLQQNPQEPVLISSTWTYTTAWLVIFFQHNTLRATMLHTSGTCQSNFSVVLALIAMNSHLRLRRSHRTSPRRLHWPSVTKLNRWLSAKYYLVVRQQQASHNLNQCWLLETIHFFIKISCRWKFSIHLYWFGLKF